MSLGIVVLGHGSQAAFPEANQVFFQVADMVKGKMAGCLVETAIFTRESGLPGMAEAVDKLIHDGAECILVVPMFLAGGVHLQSGIPSEIEVLRKKYPDVPLSLTAHIGADTRIADILVERVQEAQHSVYH